MTPTKAMPNPHAATSRITEMFQKLEQSKPLAVRLAEVLRQWPLTGVRSDIHAAPLTPLDFGGHPGLQLLYAERLLRNVKPEWVPRGPA